MYVENSAYKVTHRIILQLKQREFNLVVHMLTTQPNLVPCQYFLLHGKTNEVILPKADQWWKWPFYMLPYRCIYDALCGYISHANTIEFYCILSKNCYCCNVWNRASVTTTSQIYLALSHWEPWGEEWKTSYTQSRQLSSHLQHKLTRLVFRRIWVQIPAES